MDAFRTHDVTNQPPAFAGRDLWRDDGPLREALEREGGAAFEAEVAAYGALAGSELLDLSHDMHRDRPRPRSHNAS
ncbi:MAG: DNA alkylation response protein, partial [Gammaproteobacteria bacterium]|nr:DNA alkylation response protein [Gammaproteobacteria bacterium]